MNTRHVFTLAGRVLRQIVRDRRTLGLFLFGPILIITLIAWLIRADSAPTPIGVVNEDQGASMLLVGEIRLAERIVDEMAAGDTLLPVALTADEADAALRDGRVKGVVIFPQEFSAGIARERRAALDLTLEGSDPVQSAMLSANLMQATIRAVAGLIGGGEADGELPISVNVAYLYGGPQFDMLDYFAAPFLAIIVFIFVLMLTTVSFLRERSQGTIERLMATPATRFELVAGYMLGFLAFALVEAGLLLAYTVLVVPVHHAGNLLTVFLVEALLVLVAVNLGIFLSTFARNEFQAMQSIILVYFPMLLLSGIFWSVDGLPGILRPLAYALPLYHANKAMRDIMIKGVGLDAVWPQIVALAAISVAMLLLAAVTVRREVA